MADKPIIVPPLPFVTQVQCALCDSTGWVCEEHETHPWAGASDRADACNAGPGVPCPACQKDAYGPPPFPGEIDYEVIPGDRPLKDTKE